MKKPLKHMEQKDIESFVNKLFEEIKKTKIYDRFTLEDIKSIKDDNLDHAIWDYILKNVLKDDWSNDYQKITALPKGFQYVFATMNLENEVHNGGFNQYFYNSSGQFAEEAYLGYLAFGSKKMASIVEGAVKTLFKEMALYKKTKEAGTIEAFIESYEETELGEWDDLFYQYAKDIQKLRVKYIRKQAALFVTS